MSEINRGLVIIKEKIWPFLRRERTKVPGHEIHLLNYNTPTDRLLFTIIKKKIPHTLKFMSIGNREKIRLIKKI